MEEMSKESTNKYYTLLNWSKSLNVSDLGYIDLHLIWDMW